MNLPSILTGFSDLSFANFNIPFSRVILSTKACTSRLESSDEVVLSLSLDTPPCAALARAVFSRSSCVTLSLNF